MSKTAESTPTYLRTDPAVGWPLEEKVMNTRVGPIFEGLFCIASVAVVLVGTLAICSPGTALLGA